MTLRRRSSLRDVVAAGDGLVGRDPERAGDAPQRIELGLAVRLEIGADALVARRPQARRARSAVDAAVGQEAADLERADPVQLRDICASIAGSRRSV